MARIFGDEDMNRSFFIRVLYPAAMFFLTGMPPLNFSALAETAKVEGFIQARDGETMVLKTADSRRIAVVLNDSTQVGQVQGMFKARRKEMSMAALIPGLQVKIEGEYTDPDKMTATSVSFKGNDLERAQAMQAGMHESKMQLESHQAKLEQHSTTQQQHEEQLTANKSAIDAAVARFGQLDDYYILDEVTVYFENGKSQVDPKYLPQLLALTEKAKPINGYMIEVKGYASSSGSTELNQQLSEDRADAVTNILVQQGHVPLTRMLAPGAMGESHQVNNNESEQAEAANRRVVVRILQNKAVAGT
jgi:outer membrane protein OmpA-like peptidoglycan-associated protein